MLKKRRQLSLESLEIRRVLAASLGWDGPGLGTADLTYYLGTAPAGLGQDQFQAAVESALDAWSDVVDVNFTQTNQAGLRDSLDFSFTNLDGRGGTLAQAYFPDDVNPARIAGDIQFDASEQWEIGNSQGSAAFDLVAVAVHEIGHALGLDHISEPGSVLLPSISPNQTFVGLSADDIDAIRQLYAAEVETPPVNTPQTPIETDDADGIDEVPDNAETPTTDNRRFNNPWNRVRWSWRVSFNSFNFRGFGRLDAAVSIGHNLVSPTDVNNDAMTSAIDALLVINRINNPDTVELGFQCDTNNDGVVTAMDVLLVINELNHSDSGPTPQTIEIDAASSELDDVPNSEIELDEMDGLHDTDGHLFLGFGLGHRLHLVREATVDSVFENFDEDGNGLTEQELPSYLWDLLVRSDVDSDADGVVTRAEADAAIDNQAMRLFDDLDDDGDGLLTQTELPERMWDRISRADQDEDGGVSFEELRNYQALSRFERLDGDGDGGITSDEVSERLWRRLSRFDDDGDAIISAEEFPEPTFATRAPNVISRIGGAASRLFRRFGV